jgi:uncharacterized protein YciU (UPF0263 family)
MLPHFVGDMINRNIIRDLDSAKTAVIEFKRFSWRGEIIIDYENKVKFTIMRKNNFYRIRKRKKDTPHYVQTLVRVLNAEFESPVKQISLFDTGTFNFSNETILNDYDTIFGGHATEVGDFIYCLIAYERTLNELTEASLLFIDKDMDIIEDVALDIKPNFFALTQIDTVEEQSQEAESKSSNGLLSLKKHHPADTPHSPVAIRAEEMKA